MSRRDVGWHKPQPLTTGTYEWHLLAACRGHDDPELWYRMAFAVGAKAQDIAEAKAICRGCPVMEIGRASCRERV